MANEMISEMQNGNTNAIIDSLSHPGAIYRMNAIAYAALFRLEDAEVVDRLKGLRDDAKSLDGYSVSSFAHAALELLGAEKYTGNDVQVKELIKTRFEFMRPLKN